MDVMIWRFLNCRRLDGCPELRCFLNCGAELPLAAATSERVCAQTLTLGRGCERFIKADEGEPVHHLLADK